MKADQTLLTALSLTLLLRICTIMPTKPVTLLYWQNELTFRRSTKNGTPRLPAVLEATMILHIARLAIVVLANLLGGCASVGAESLAALGACLPLLRRRMCLGGWHEWCWWPDEVFREDDHIALVAGLWMSKRVKCAVAVAFGTLGFAEG